ncbi:MAG: hypothetical protein ACR2K2_00225, partial [Mycobacteriales bacterium]
WTSPLNRVYHRPSPHDPPPRVDPYQDPPPLRPPPTATPTRWATAAPRPPTGEAAPAGGPGLDTSTDPEQHDADDLDDPPPF